MKCPKCGKEIPLTWFSEPGDYHCPVCLTIIKYNGSTNEAIAPKASSKAGKKWAWILLVAILLLTLGAGFHFYKKHSLKTTLRPIVLKDNVLIEEIINISKNSPNITYGEFFEKAKKNIENREDIILSIKVVDSYFYQKELDMYIDLLRVENEYVRSEISLARAQLDVNSKIEWTKRERENYLDSSYYVSDIYLKSYKKSIKEVETSFKKYKEKHKEYVDILNKFLSKEKNYSETLSKILPSRNLIPTLDEKFSEQSEVSRKLLSKEKTKM